MARPSRIIDAHQHAFWHGRDDAALVADLDEHGIEKAVLLTWDATPLEQGAGAYEEAFNPAHADSSRPHRGLPLADVVEAVRRHPERFVAGYCPHPLDPCAVRHLAAAIRMYDVRICGEWKAAIALDDPRCVNLFRFCGEHELPVLFHLDVPFRPFADGEGPKYSLEWYGGTPANVARTLQACPDTRFIAHGPGFWRHISGDAETAAGGYPAGRVTPGGQVAALLDGFENLCADLSATSALNALQRDPGHGRAFVLKYHDRLLFGRDECSGGLDEFLRGLDLPAEATENIYHRNAERLLRGEI